MTTETTAPDASATEQHERPQIVCLCGSTRFYDEFQQANYDLTMQGAIVLSVGFYPHAKARHGHGEGVGHDSAEKTALDELHKRKIDLADEVLVVSDESGYFGSSTAGEIRYAVEHRKPVRFAVPASESRAREAGLLAGAEDPGLRWDFPLGRLAATGLHVETATEKPVPAELWQQACGDRDEYMRLMREHGHVITPGEAGYDPGAPKGLACGWEPGK